MAREYDALEIEQKWQKHWQVNSTYSVEESLNKTFYCLSMLPYPSGELHMGHVRNYTIGDTIARWRKIQGYNVLQPIGWDSFGLPAENAAITNKISPATWTQNNIKKMREQFVELGMGYDWKREITTCMPDYYRWNQWLFLKMYEMNLVYQKQAFVNWDPVDCTVLANEQVVNGRGWRSGAIVEKKEINQWFFKITAYAEELLTELDNLTGWPEQVCTMQKNWIGKSVGHNIKFSLADTEETIEVFTSRAETLFGVSFIAVAPEHPALSHSKKPDIAELIDQCQQGSTAEADLAKTDKIGFDTGLKAIHPATNAEVPVFVTNYVLMNYGTGAVMGVPAHDERDQEFAQLKGLEIKEVIANDVLINSGEFDSMELGIAKEKIGAKFGQAKTSYRLRDWGISRQRYWGTPIPIVYCDDCGVVPVKEQDLPVVLPTDLTPAEFTNTLANTDDFVNTTCPICAKPSKRETDTMDTFVDSSWYYARYTCSDQNHSMLDERAKYWTPVDQYVGGIEHATMHLLYARFIHKVLRDLELVNSNEPFTNLLTQGMVLLDGSKMSKSKGNIISPKELINKYGSDTIRLLSIFAAPPEQALEWQDGGVEGANRFLGKLWQFAINNKENIKTNTKAENSEHRSQLHLILKQALLDYEKLQLNTVVSACMKILKLISQVDDWQLAAEGLEILLVLLHPICPHITLEIWQELGFSKDLASYGELTVDSKCLNTELSLVVIQVNGKTRAKIKCKRDINTDDLFELCKQHPELEKYLELTPKKVIHIPNKLANFVI